MTQNPCILQQMLFRAILLTLVVAAVSVSYSDEVAISITIVDMYLIDAVVVDCLVPLSVRRVAGDIWL